MPFQPDETVESRIEALPPPQTAPPEHPRVAVAFWRTLVRFEWDKITPWLAFRNTVGISIPLVAGLFLHSLPAGLVMATGALNVCFSDGDDAYQERARRMLLSSLLVSMAVCIGANAAHSHLLIACMTAAWAFAAGMLIALGSTAGDIGVVTLVTLIVFGGQPMTADRALYSGLLAGVGGLLQTGLALLFWPVRPHRPQRFALRDLFRELAKTVTSHMTDSVAPPATAQANTARNILGAIASDRHVESERYLYLLHQAERMRLSLFVLARLRRRLRRETDGVSCAEALDEALAAAARLLDDMAVALDAGRPIDKTPRDLMAVESISERLHAECLAGGAQSLSALKVDARSQVDALLGQLRAALDLTSSASGVSRSGLGERAAREPWYLRLEGVRATLRANLSLQSTTFRHAVRLAVCLLIGEFVAFSVGWGRSYWLPMTIALVLKPDFTATFSRGVLRLAGTFAGLILTTVLLRLLPHDPLVPVGMVILAVFTLRCFGPANYGLLVGTVTALVVFLIGLTGVPAHQLIADRAWNTAVGGILCMVAYAVWPTWERTQAAEMLARLLDAYRDYFRAIRDSYVQPERYMAAKLDSARLAARLARANMEASFDRVVVEPGTPVERSRLLGALSASSHRVVYSLMALEAGLSMSRSEPPRQPFHAFARDVDLTLYYLSAGLRGSYIAPSDLPDLRQDHHELTHSGDPLTLRYALVNTETDRLTNSLNTLALQVFEWLQSK